MEMNVTVLVLYKDGIAETKHYNKVGLMTKYHILSNKVNNCKLLMGKSSLRYSCTVRCHLRIYFFLSYSYNDCIYSKVTRHLLDFILVY